MERGNKMKIILERTSPVRIDLEDWSSKVPLAAGLWIEIQG